MIKTLTRTSLLFAAIIALSALAGAPAQATYCFKASRCHGPLPDICRKCPDGHNGCAHHACVHHRCVIRFCS